MDCVSFTCLIKFSFYNFNCSIQQNKGVCIGHSVFMEKNNEFCFIIFFNLLITGIYRMGLVILSLNVVFSKETSSDFAEKYLIFFFFLSSLLK